MSDQSENQVEEVAAENLPMPSELDMLKDRATMMGIKFSNNIGVDALKKKIADAMEGIKDEDEPVQQAAANPFEAGQAPVTAAKNVLDPTGAGARKVTVAEQIRLDAMKLVRVRITNMDPRDKDLPGEIFSVGNDFIGNVKKYVPYDGHDEGYHIPQCIYDMLVEKQFLQIKTIKKPNGGTENRQIMARKFAIEVLPPLTEQELHELKVAQAAAAGK